jgi:phosphatidylglycerophosphate synthase
MGGFVDLASSSFARIRGSRGLTRSMLGWTGAGLVLGEAFAVGVAQLQSTTAAVVVGILTLLWWVLVTAVPLVSTTLLVTPEGERVDRLGVPNGLTVMRAYSCPGLTACAFCSTPHRIGFILWATVGAVAAVLDLVDGYIARRIGPLTRLGEALDPVMDCAFFSVAAAGNIALGIVPRWVGGVMLARYAGPLGFGIVFQFLGRRPELAATVWGKRTTVLTSAMLAVLLVVRSAEGPVELVGIFFGLPLAAMTLLHFGIMARREQVAAVAGVVPALEQTEGAGPPRGRG